MRLAIGDVHGKPFWKHYLDEDYTAFYFTGDYFDSHDPSVGFQQQYKNFVEICAAARKDKRIRLCLGNHDYHYLKGVDEQYSSFQAERSSKISAVLEQNMDLLAIVRTDGDYLISHAGVTNYFLESLGFHDPLEINNAFAKNRKILVFNGENVYGDDPTQSPIWIRPSSLCADPLAGYNQIVGHTPVNAISEVTVNDGKNRIILIDTYDTESIYRF
jgi:predicted MPP superfamily phosphohydrolase